MRQPFKSVHLTNYYHKTSGGISTAYNKLLEAANRHQRLVRLIVPGEKEETEDIGEFGKIYYVAAKPFPLFDKRYRVLMPQSYIQNQAPVRKILTAEKPDMIEICDKYTLTMLAGMIRQGYQKELNRPMLVGLSCERMDDNVRAHVTKGNLGNWFSRKLMGNYNFPMFDFYLANSNYTAQELFDSVPSPENPTGANAFFNFCWRFFNAAQIPINERVFVAPCGADSEYFRPERRDTNFRKQILSENDLPDSSKLLLYAGRISPEKNVGLLADLMKILSKDSKNDFRLIIAGDGPKAAWLKEEVEKFADGKIKFLGHLDKEKLADVYANSDVFVHPNPREPFGIGPLEAMASGLPVVAPNSGGLLTYSTDQNSWLCEPTAENFANAICNVILEENTRNIKINNALTTVREFTWEKSTDSIFEIYDRMYVDFQARRDFYVSQDAKKIDFAKQLKFKN